MTTEIPAKSLPGLSWFFALLVLHAVAVAGIAVLPPDINRSGAEFRLEARADASAASASL